MDEAPARVPVSGRGIGPRIAQALGLRATTFLQITIPLEGPVVVTCRYYPTDTEMAHVATILEEFHIVPRNLQYADSLKGRPVVDSPMYGHEDDETEKD